jgi:hypothetical protein
MNAVISSHTARDLWGESLGQSAAVLTPLATDAGGRMILSPSLQEEIAASNLDIRPLTPGRDSLLMQGTNLDIRDLNGERDSIKTQARFFAQDSESGTVPIGSRNFLTKDLSNYPRNTYVVLNTGGVAVTINFQIAPIDDDSYYVNDGSSFNLLIGGEATFSPSRPARFARIRVSALLLGGVEVYYFGGA